jgi:hypothetical protein
MTPPTTPHPRHALIAVRMQRHPGSHTASARQLSCTMALKEIGLLRGEHP